MAARPEAEQPPLFMLAVALTTFKPPYKLVMPVNMLTAVEIIVQAVPFNSVPSGLLAAAGLPAVKNVI